MRGRNTSRLKARYFFVNLFIIQRQQVNLWQRTGSKSWTGKEERGKKQYLFNTHSTTAVTLTGCSPWSWKLHQPVSAFVWLISWFKLWVFTSLCTCQKKRKAVNRLEKPCTLQGLQFVIALVCLCSEINFTKQTGVRSVCLCLLLPWHAFSPTVSAWSKVMHL